MEKKQLFEPLGYGPFFILLKIHEWFWQESVWTESISVCRRFFDKETIRKLLRYGWAAPNELLWKCEASYVDVAY